MTYNVLKKSVTVVICIFLLCMTGCGVTETTPPKINLEKPTITNTEYNTINGGLTTFSENYYAMKTYLANNLTVTKPENGLNDIERSYYDNFLLLMSVIDVELSILPEFDFLDVTKDYPDRKEGNLIVSGYYGYEKIDLSSKLCFGYDESNGKSVTGDIYNNFFNMTADESIKNGVSCKTVIEIVMDKTDAFVMRAVKSVTDTEKNTTMTKTAYILMRDNSATLAYYEGNIDASRYIGFDTFIDYNMNALTFGVGTVLSFAIKLDA